MVYTLEYWREDEWYSGQPNPFKIPIILIFSLLAGGCASTPQTSIPNWTINAQLTFKQPDELGWGYSVSNDAHDKWLVIRAINADPIDYGKSDSSIFDLPVVPPGGTHTVPYTGKQGLFRINLSTITPNLNDHAFIISADWHTSDPSKGGSFVDRADERKLPFK